MFKHIIGQSIFQLVVLLIILFYGTNFLLENNDKNSKKVFTFKYCLDADILVEPFANVTLENFDVIKPKVYVLAGLQTRFSNSKKNFTLPDPALCNEFFNEIKFDSKLNITQSNIYNSLVDVNLFKFRICMLLLIILSFLTPSLI